MIVKREFTTIVHNQTCGCQTKFVVIKGRINSPPLLGKQTLIELGMLEIKADVTLEKQNELRIRNDDIINVSNNRQKQQEEITQLLEKYQRVFQGIRKITDKTNSNDFTVKFSMKPDALPVAQKPRPVPYYLQDPLKKWLNQCLEEDIFERVEGNKPITPTVV